MVEKLWVEECKIQHDSHMFLLMKRAYLSLTSTISAACLVISVPAIPIATPTSACLIAGASREEIRTVSYRACPPHVSFHESLPLTPSPVIATNSPRFCKAVTIFNLLSGLTRANTFGNGFSSTIASSESKSNSLPRMARL